MGVRCSKLNWVRILIWFILRFIVDQSNAHKVIPKIDYIFTVKEANKKLSVEKLASNLRCEADVLTSILRDPASKVQLLSSDFLTDCLKAKKLLDITAKHKLDLSYPRRMLSSISDKIHPIDEEEKRDLVVGLEDIMEDVYKQKFNNG